MDDRQLKTIAENLGTAVRLLAASPPELAEASRLVYAAYQALEEMLEPPDPYKDMNLRPALKRLQEETYPAYRLGGDGSITRVTEVPDE